MKFNHKLTLLSCIAIIGIAIVFSMKPIAQNIGYHNFIDSQTIFNIPNFNNVISNIGFILLGCFGFAKVKTINKKNSLLYFLLGGIFLTGIGSGYYHWNPNNITLFFDRLPMVVVFMTFFTFILANYITEKDYKAYLILLLGIGIMSILYWSYTESLGIGDLRPYIIVQFLPIILIPIILLLFKKKNNNSYYIFPVLAFYILAKLSEHFDEFIYTVSKEIISGHSIKHFLAAIAAYYIYKWVDSLQKTV